jgi:hypothetical protein
VKNFVPVVVALVIGIVLGAWQPRGELLEARKQMDDLRAKAKSGNRSGGSALAGIQQILRAKPPAQPGQTPEPTSAAAGSQAADNAPDGTSQTPDIPTDTPPPTAEDIRQQVGVMQATLDARRAQAMAALTEQGELTEDQQAEVSNAMAEMNSQLKAEVERFVAAANAGEDLDRRDAMEFTANSLDVVLAADDKMREILPAEVYDAVDSEAVDPFSYLSGDAVESLSKLEALPAFEQ